MDKHFTGVGFFCRKPESSQTLEFVLQRLRFHPKYSHSDTPECEARRVGQMELALCQNRILSHPREILSLRHPEMQHWHGVLDLLQWPTSAGHTLWGGSGVGWRFRPISDEREWRVECEEHFIADIRNILPQRESITLSSQVQSHYWKVTISETRTWFLLRGASLVIIVATHKHIWDLIPLHYVIQALCKIKIKSIWEMRYVFAVIVPKTRFRPQRSHLSEKFIRMKNLKTFRLVF